MLESLSYNKTEISQEACEEDKVESLLWIQVKQNVQRTLAIELQKLSIQFRKQQKQFLKKVSQKDGVTLSSSSLSFLEESGPSVRGGEDDYDPGFSDLQVNLICSQTPNQWTPDDCLEHILNQGIWDACHTKVIPSSDVSCWNALKVGFLETEAVR